MVITFITSSNLKKCASNLDYKRLGKQRVEAKQIIEAIEFRKSKWIRHPASKMWKDHLIPLKIYYNHMVREWVSRGYNNTLQLYDINEEEYSVIESTFDGIRTTLLPVSTKKTFPWWFGWEPFVNSHKASLLRKDPKFYMSFHSIELESYADKGYLWPDSLPSTALTDFSVEFFSPVGGVMHSYHRYSKSDVILWLENKERNPKTGKKIKVGGPIYLDLTAACVHYKL
jgi:hypothetical protein